MKKLFFILATVLATLPSCQKIYDEINTLDDRIALLEEVSIPSIEEQIMMIKNSINNLKGVDDMIKNQILELQNTTKSLKQSIQELEKELENKDADIYDLSRQLSTLRNELTNITQDIATLEQNESIVESKIRELETYISAEINDIKDAVSAANSTVAQLNSVKTELNNIKSNLSNLNASISELEKSINNMISDLNEQITNIEQRLSNVENRINRLLNRIQTITYVPKYNDGMATMKYIPNTTTGTMVLDFEITPKDAVAELEKVWSNILYVKAIYTETRAFSFVDMPIISFDSDTLNGIISITVSGNKMSKDFFDGHRTAKVNIVLSDEDSSVASEYITVTTSIANDVKIGDYLEVNGIGGVVFITDGTSGKMVSVKRGLSSWSSKTGYETGATDLYDGYANTKSIINGGHIDFHPAFQWCISLGEGWYLPAIQELLAIYGVVGLIDKTFSEKGYPSFNTIDYCYWSSTESSTEEDRAEAFRGYIEDRMPKTYLEYVRAVYCF